MHPITLPQDVQDRVIARRGKLHIYEEIDPKRTALVVIDMQNIFLEPERRDFIQFNFKDLESANEFKNNILSLDHSEIIDYANNNNILFNE